MHCKQKKNMQFYNHYQAHNVVHCKKILKKNKKTNKWGKMLPNLVFIISCKNILMMPQSYSLWIINKIKIKMHQQCFSGLNIDVAPLAPKLSKKHKH